MRVLVLPYLVDEAGRERPSTPEMELASILCLAEAGRRRPGIFGGRSERVVAVSKLHYPLWMVPWRGGCLILDGLAISSHTITKSKIPDLEAFTEEVEEKLRNRKEFLELLVRHGKTFKEPLGTDQVAIPSLLGEGKLLNSILEYLPCGNEAVAGCPTSLIPPRMGGEDAAKQARRLVEEWRRIRGEIEGLRFTIRLLEGAVKLHEEKIRREIKSVQADYHERMERLKPAVEEEVERLIDERDAKIQRVVKRMDQELETLSRRKSKLEDKLLRLRQEEIRCERRLEEAKQGRGENTTGRRS